MSAAAIPTCHLQDVLGRVEACPGSRCPLWNDGHGCVVDELHLTTWLDLRHRQDVAEWLLGIRSRLEAERGAREGSERQLFRRLSPPA
jgi:hypothetical protein